MAGGGRGKDDWKQNTFGPVGTTGRRFIPALPNLLFSNSFNIQAVVLTITLPTLLIFGAGLRQNQSTWKPACYMTLLAVDFKKRWYEGTRTVLGRNRWSYAGRLCYREYAHLLPRNIAGAFTDDLSKFLSSLSFHTWFGYKYAVESLHSTAIRLWWFFSETMFFLRNIDIIVILFLLDVLFWRVPIFYVLTVIQIPYKSKTYTNSLIGKMIFFLKIVIRIQDKNENLCIT